MIRTAFNDEWTVRPKVGVFESDQARMPPASVALPHDALRDLPRHADNGVHSGYFPGGVFEYEKSFHVPEQWRSKTVLFEFEGVYRDAMVYLNGDFVAHEASGYAAFAVAADGFLRFGTVNTLTVEARAHKDSRWYTGAGIYRPVHLVVAEPVHIALNGLAVTTPDIDDERGVVHVATTIQNETRHLSTTRILLELRGPDGVPVASSNAPVTVLPGRKAVARSRLVVTDPLLWSPDAARLYVLNATLCGEDGTTLDQDSTRFGIRRLQLDPRHGLRINGVTVDLRGACIHHDNGPLGGISHPAAEDRRVRKLKAAGFNAIRSAHNPASRELLDACDRHGMLVMDELTDVWNKSKTTFDSSIGFDKRWRDEIAALVTKDINHPSVVMYSIGNEILELASPHGATWSRRLAEEFRRLDDTRFITNGVNGVVANLDRLAEAEAEFAADPNTLMAGMGERLAVLNASALVTTSTEESAAALDVVGLNYSESRYAMDAEVFPHRIIVGTETFPDKIAGLWVDVRRHPHVIGDFTWAGWDYIGEAGIGRVDYSDVEGYQESGVVGEFPYLLAGCGDIDITGHRKPASYYREIAFGLRSEPTIAVHRPQNHGRPVVKTPWSWDDVVSSWTWGVEAGSPVTVDVYADADEVRLFLNGDHIGTSIVGDQRSLVASFETEYWPGELAAVALRDGIEVGRSRLTTAQRGPSLSLRAEALSIPLTGLAYIHVGIEDSNGVSFCDADRRVTVTVSGGGEIAGVASGRARTTEPFTGPSITTHDGKAIVVVRPLRHGEFVVEVSAEDLAAAHATVLVQ